MIRKMTKYKLLILLFLLKLSSYGYEAGLYSLEINKKVKTNGTKVYFIDNKTYVELQELLRVLDITNNQWINDNFTIDVNNIYGLEKTINLRDKYIKVGNEKIKYTNEIIEDNDKIFVSLDELDEVLGIKEVEIDEDRLLMKMKTNFVLPIELNNIRKYKKSEFENGSNATKKDVYTEKKLFAPGNLRLMYNYGKAYQPDSYEYKYLDSEYLGPLLYGNLEMYYGIYPELQNYQTRLRYSDVYKGHDIIFGDVGVTLPQTLRGTVSGIRGISFTKDYGIRAEYDEDVITISGDAPLGKFVELYKNGELLTYVDVRNGKYVFENVSSVFGSDTFQILIYNHDGSIKKEILNRYSSDKLERKGDFGYNFHAGESTYDRYNQFIGEVNYGLTDNLTLRTGFYDLQYKDYYMSSTDENTKSYMIGAYHVNSFDENPYSIDLELLHNNDGDNDIYTDMSYNVKDYMFTAEIGDYSGKTANRIGKDSEIYLSASKSKVYFKNLSVGLKYYETDYSYSRKEREYGAVFRTKYGTMIPEYGIYINPDRDAVYHDFSVRSYYFNDYTLYGGVYHKTIRDYDETRYRVEISTRRTSENGIRYRAFYEKSDRYGSVYGLSFDIDYNTWLTAGASYSRSNGKSNLNSGLTIDKVISLSDVNSNVTSVENGNIQGIVYMDNNYNGVYDLGIDKPLPRTQILANGIVSVTGIDGKYSVPNLYPDRYDIRIEPQNPLYKSQYDRYRGKIEQASTLELDIPVYPRKIVNGMINIENQSLMYRYIRTLFFNVTDVKTGHKIEVVVPETDGFFTAENLTLGKYKFVLESTDKPGVALYEKEIDVLPETKEINMDLNITGDNVDKLQYDLELY